MDETRAVFLFIQTARPVISLWPWLCKIYNNATMYVMVPKCCLVRQLIEEAM